MNPQVHVKAVRKWIWLEWEPWGILEIVSMPYSAKNSRIIMRCLTQLDCKMCVELVCHLLLIENSIFISIITIIVNLIILWSVAEIGDKLR